MNNLRNKIFLLTIGMIVPISIFLTVWDMSLMREQLEDEFQLRGLALTRTFMYLSAHNLVSPTDMRLLKYFVESLSADPDLEAAYLFSPDGKPLLAEIHHPAGGSEEPFKPDPALWNRALSSFTPQIGTQSHFGHLDRTIYQRLWLETPHGIETRAVWVVRFNVYRIERTIRNAAISNFWTVLACLSVALLVGFWFSSRITEPVNRLREAADAIGRGNFSLSVPASRRDEIGSLARSFDAMGKSLRDTLKANADLLGSLREEKAKLTAVFSQMEEPVLVTDDHGRVMLLNAAAHRFLPGLSTGTALADAVKEMQISPPLSELLSSLEKSIAFELVRETPKPIVMAGTAALIEFASPDTDHGYSGRLLFLRDVTEARREEKVKQSFIAMISHKFYTPLSIVIGYTQTLRDLDVEKPKRKMMMDAVLEQSHRVVELVDKLLRFSRLQQAQLGALSGVEVDIDDMLKHVVSQMHGWLETHHGVVDLSGSPLGKATIDPDLMQGAIKELIENAVKFNPAAQKKVHIVTESAKPSLMIHVADDGPGIPPEDQERIYSKFYQVEANFTGQVNGWGLGLAYVRKVIEAHGGTLSMESALGKGTKITLVMPASAAARPSRPT